MRSIEINTSTDRSQQIYTTILGIDFILTTLVLVPKERMIYKLDIVKS